MLAADRSRAHNCITKEEAEAELGPNITGATWELGRNPKKLIVAGLLLEELLIGGIRFIFFSNWGGIIYIEQR